MSRAYVVRTEKLSNDWEEIAWSVITGEGGAAMGIAYAGLPVGRAFNDRKLIIFRCASSYSPSRNELKLFQRVMGLTS